MDWFIKCSTIQKPIFLPSILFSIIILFLRRCVLLKHNKLWKSQLGYNFSLDNHHRYKISLPRLWIWIYVVWVSGVGEGHGNPRPRRSDPGVCRLPTSSVGKAELGSSLGRLRDPWRWQSDKWAGCVLWNWGSPPLWALGNRAKEACCRAREGREPLSLLPAPRNGAFLAVSTLTSLSLARPHVYNPMGVALLKWLCSPQVILKALSAVQLAAMLRNRGVSVRPCVCSLLDALLSRTRLPEITGLGCDWVQRVHTDGKQ